MRSLSGATAFITGGAEGIGLGIARALADEGANIVLADIDAVTLEQAVADLERRGARVTRVACTNELYVFTHPHYRELVDQGGAALGRAFVTAEESPALADVERGKIVI